MTEKCTTDNKRIQNDGSLQSLSSLPLHKKLSSLPLHKKIQFTRIYNSNCTYNSNQKDKVFRTILKRHIRAFMNIKIIQGTFYTDLLNRKTQYYKNISAHLMYQFNVILTKIQDFKVGSLSKNDMKLKWGIK